MTLDLPALGASGGAMPFEAVYRATVEVIADEIGSADRRSSATGQEVTEMRRADFETAGHHILRDTRLIDERLKQSDEGWFGAHHATPPRPRGNLSGGERAVMPGATPGYVKRRATR